MKKFLMTLALLGAGLILFSLTAILLIPADMIMSSVKERLQAGPGFILTEESSERLLPFGIRADGLLVSNRAADALYLDTVTVKFAPLGLLSGGLKALIEATIADGSIKGYALLKRGFSEIELEADGVDLDAVPAIVRAGFKGPGSVSGRASVKLPAAGCPEATINLKGIGLDGENLSIKGFSLPFGRITDAGLKARALECRAEILNLWVDGSGMSARVSGVISLTEPVEQSVVDLHIEIVPRGPEDPMLSLLLKGYRRSANYYSIKVGGTLGSPIVRP